MRSVKMVKCDFLVFSGESGQICELSGWVSGEDGAVQRDASLWVSPEALTPGGFDAIFPRRESTWEELVNNICPSSGRLTPIPNPLHLYAHHFAVNLITSHRSHHSGQACPSWTGHPRPLQAQIKGPDTGKPNHKRSKQFKSVIGANSWILQWWRSSIHPLHADCILRCCLIWVSEEASDLSLRLCKDLRACSEGVFLLEAAQPVEQEI